MSKKKWPEDYWEGMGWVYFFRYMQDRYFNSKALLDKYFFFDVVARALQFLLKNFIVTRLKKFTNKKRIYTPLHSLTFCRKIRKLI